MPVLGGYADLERIGHGGLGDVYRATRTSTGATVAIKVLRDVSDASTAWNRTRRELTALISLGGHAHVIQVHELLTDAPGLVMEYAPGGSVAQLLERRRSSLPVDELTMIGRQTAAALTAAHEQGIVHRDVKPQNLLIDTYGQVKLCDFGIASLARTEEFRTRTSAISMRYASPEDLEEDAPVGPAADVYSLGATLLHLAHGAPPTLKERLAPWSPPPTDDPDLARLDEILVACLQPEPADRPSAADLLDRFESLESQLVARCRALPVQAPPAEPTGADEAVLAFPTGERAFDGDDAPTQHRTGRTPPTPPRPVPATQRRPSRRLTAVVGAGVVVVAVVGLLLLGGGDAAAPSDALAGTVTTAVASDGPTVVERPAGLAPLDGPDITWPLGAIGECLVQLPDVATLGSIGCDQPHDLQRYGVGSLGVGDVPGDAPTDAELEQVVADRCRADAPSIAAVELRLAQTNPSAASWADGDRAYQCLVGVPDHRLVGSTLD